jgi:hypothetical protein
MKISIIRFPGKEKVPISPYIKAMNFLLSFVIYLLESLYLRFGDHYLYRKKNKYNTYLPRPNPTMKSISSSLFHKLWIRSCLRSSLCHRIRIDVGYLITITLREILRFSDEYLMK